MSATCSASHRAYAVLGSPDTGECLIDIGFATSGIDGGDLTVKLHAVPTEGDIVLRRVGAEPLAADTLPASLGR